MNKGIKHHVYKVMEYNIGMTFYEPSWDKPEINELILEGMNINCMSNDYVDITLQFSRESNGVGYVRYKLDDVGYHIYTQRDDAERKIAEMYGIRLSEEQ